MNLTSRGILITVALILGFVVLALNSGGNVCAEHQPGSAAYAACVDLEYP